MDELEQIRVLFQSLLRVGRAAKTSVVGHAAGLVRLAPVVLVGVTAAVIIHRRRR